MSIANKTLGLILILSCSYVTAPLSFAQEDPLEVQRQRNAALEAVSPVLEREENYVPTPAEEIEIQFGSVRRNAVLINEILDDITKMGRQADQAKLLTQLNPNSLEVIRSLIDLEAKRIEDNEALAQGPVKPSPTASARPAQQSAPVVAPSPKDMEVVVMMVRPYEDGDKPTKVILKVGEESPKAYFVGEEVTIAGRGYSLSDVQAIGDNPKIKGRTLYRVILERGSDVKRIDW